MNYQHKNDVCETIRSVADEELERSLLNICKERDYIPVPKHRPADVSEFRNLFVDQEAFSAWLERYNHRLKQQDRSDQARQKRMKQVNPKYILRNYLAQTAIEKAEKERDYSEVDRLLNLLYQPFDEHPGMESYLEAPPAWGKSLVISCSS